MIAARYFNAYKTTKLYSLECSLVSIAKSLNARLVINKRFPKEIFDQYDLKLTLHFMPKSSEFTLEYTLTGMYT